MYPEEKYVFTFEDKRQRNVIHLTAEYIYFGGGEEDREELEMYKFLTQFIDEFGWYDIDNNWVEEYSNKNVKLIYFK